MTKKPFLLGCATVRLQAGAAILPAVPVGAAIPVFDTANYAQNLLQAARALEGINNQIRSLQNEAAILQAMARNLERIDFPELGRITSALERVDGLMAKAQGIGFGIDRLDERLRQAFPGEVDEAFRSDRRVAEARERLDAAMDGYLHSMRVQAEVAGNVKADAALLADLVARSQSASGSLQATQATNQLIALGAKQQMQLQALMAAEFRSQSIERARRAQSEIEARSAARRFLGSGKAYTPR